MEKKGIAGTFAFDARLIAVVAGYVLYVVWSNNVCVCAGAFLTGFAADAHVQNTVLLRMEYCAVLGVLEFAVCFKAEEVYRFIFKTRWGNALAVIVVAAASPLAAAASFNAPSAVSCAAVLAVAASFALFIYWVKVLSSLPIATLFGVVASAFAIASLLPNFIAGEGAADPTAGVVACSALGVAALAVLLASDRLLAGRPLAEREPFSLALGDKATEKGRASARAVTLRFSACVLIWFFVLRCQGALLSQTGGGAVVLPFQKEDMAGLCLALVLSAAVVLLFCLPTEFKLEWVYRFLFLISLATTLLSILFPPGSGLVFVVRALNFASLQLFAMVMRVVETALSTNKHLTPMRVATFVGGFWALGSASGLLASRCVAGRGEEAFAAAIVLLALLLAVCYVIVLTERDVALLTEAIPEMRRRPFKERCLAIGRRYHLTEREVEIMAYVAIGRDTPYIQEALCLSKNTVNFHRKNLYAKLGIHSKQELLDLVGSQEVRR